MGKDHGPVDCARCRAGASARWPQIGRPGAGRRLFRSRKGRRVSRGVSVDGGQLRKLRRDVATRRQEVKSHRSTQIGTEMNTLEEQIRSVYKSKYREFCNGVLALTGTRQAAKDAVQEGFAQALRDQRKFRGEGALEGWIWRIVFRAAVRTRPTYREHPLDPRFPDTVELEDARDPNLARAIRSLPPRRRLIVFLRHFAGLSYTEIALICGISEGAVAATLSVAHLKSLQPH